MLTVATTFSPEGYELYGKKFIETFNRYWDANLVCVWEGPCPDPAGINGFDLLQYEPAKDFYERHATNPIVRGIEEHPKWKWSPKSKRKGYSFRHDAWKFSHKVFALAAVTRYVDGGKFFFMDADIVTYKEVPTDVIVGLLVGDTSLCYLARREYHSELSFVGYNLERAGTRKFISEYERQYAEDRFLETPFWDDCNQFDMLVKEMEPNVYHIPHARPAQPFDDSILGKYMRHLKGLRKAA